MLRLNDEFNCPTNYHAHALGQAIDLLDFVATGALLYARRKVIMDRDWTIENVAEWVTTLDYPWNDPEYRLTSIFERISSLRLQSDLGEEITDQWLWSIKDILIRVIGNPAPYFNDGTLDVP